MARNHSNKDVDSFIKVSDGTVLRYRHWPSSKNITKKASVLLLQGRGTPLEKFDHIIPILQKRGYEIWGFDWRGQGLSSREAGKRSHIKRYKLYLDDLDVFVKTFLKIDRSKTPLIILGQSMGGHIGLRYMAENPGVIDGAVMTAPMLDLNCGAYSKNFSLWGGKLMVFLGLGKQYIYSASKYDPSTLPFEGNSLTHNREIFYYHRHLLIKNPNLISKGVTFGWIRATLHSIKKLNCSGMLGRIDAPVKIFAAEEESVIDNSGLEKITRWIPNCESEIIANARHLLLFEEPPVISKIIQGLDCFTEKHFSSSWSNGRDHNEISSLKFPVEQNFHNWKTCS